MGNNFLLNAETNKRQKIFVIVEFLVLAKEFVRGSTVTIITPNEEEDNFRNKAVMGEILRSGFE